MQLANDKIIINYNEEDKEYVTTIFDKINTMLPKYLNFFDTEKLNYPIIINLYNDINQFQNTIKNRNGGKSPKSYIAAITHKNIIDSLSLNERRKISEHKNTTEEEYIMVFLHELFHICHINYMGDNSKCTWLAEGLACYFGNPVYQESTIDCSVEDLLNLQAHYKYYYTLTKYIIENYDHSYVLKLAKDPKLLFSQTEEIVRETNKYLNKKHKK